MAGDGFVKVIGSEAIITGASGNGYIRLNSYIASISTLVNIIVAPTSISKAIRVAIYDDSAGDPNNLLSESDEFISIAGGLSYIPLQKTVHLRQGVTYWLGAQEVSGSDGLMQYVGGAVGVKYKAYTYGAFPDPITGLSSAAGYDQALQGGFFANLRDQFLTVNRNRFQTRGISRGILTR